MSKMPRMWIYVLVLLLLGAHLNLTALVPLQVGEPAPPWWVGGMLFWTFAVDTNTLLSAEITNAITPMLSIISGVCFLLAGAALLQWRVPDQWFRWLIVAGALFSIVLQVNWFTVWAILPLGIDLVLLWGVFGMQFTARGLRQQ